MEKTVVFDMDGTLADFYGVEGWLEDLETENVRPYAEAKPMFSMLSLKRQIRKMKKVGWVFKVITWGSKQSSPEFLERTKIAKLDWLKQYGLLDEMDSIDVVSYGTPKHELAMGILFDDNESICADWDNAGGQSINVTKVSLMKTLRGLVENV